MAGDVSLKSNTCMSPRKKQSLPTLTNTITCLDVSVRGCGAMFITDHIQAVILKVERKIKAAVVFYRSRERSVQTE